MSLKIYARKLWEALAPKAKYDLPVYPVPVVYIHHSVSGVPLDLFDGDGDGIPDNEEKVWKAIQFYHMFTRMWSDIAYNFGATLSGAVLKGRGWRRQGGATGSPQDRYSLSICAIGDFQAHAPSGALVTAIVDWIITGIELGHIRSDVIILGHKDKPYATSCPGKFLHSQIPNIRSRVAAGRMDETMIGLPTDDNWLADVKDTSDGHKSEAIRLWQYTLSQWGFMELSEVDGIKGPGTRAAHKAWETAQGYGSPNGKPGRVSWPKLLEGPPPKIRTVTVEVVKFRTDPVVVDMIVRLAEQIDDQL